MRQYWRDFDALERWARSSPHQEWWRTFLRDSGGTGFWHETYFMRGGMEAVYDDMVQATGLLKFAPVRPARGGMFSARGRAQRAGEPAIPAPLPGAIIEGLRTHRPSLSETSTRRLSKLAREGRADSQPEYDAAAPF